MTIAELWQLTRDLDLSLVEEDAEVYYPAFGETRMEQFVSVMQGERELVQYAVMRLMRMEEAQMRGELTKYARREKVWTSTRHGKY